ncbi:MAG: class I SAM-dependent methyltransferase [Candidatus Nealsonbacteria bacterium]|nr:MAG: class I SAM-dependent methyltransferase [Candidatus Nealsonbacteria bacterium]
MEGFLNPQEVLKQLKLKKEMIAADFGCGSGGWALPLAKKLEEGIIYAIDILEEPLSALKARAKLEKILNIEIIRADVEKRTPLSSNSVDLVLMTDLLFECEDKKIVVEEGKRVLKPGGKILVVDWKLDATIGPEEGRVSTEEVKKIAKDLNLKLEKEFEAGIYHWGLIVVK